MLQKRHYNTPLPGQGFIHIFDSVFLSSPPLQKGVDAFFLGGGGI